MVRISEVMAAVAAITLSSAIAHAQSGPPPSLADVARQTAAQWATGKRAAKVYTNASLATVPEDVTPATVTVATATPATAASTPTSQTAATSATAPAREQTTKPAEDENTWREEAASKRRDLEQARTALAAQEAAAAEGTPAQRRDAARRVAQAQRTFEYVEKRWNAFLQSAQAAKVPPAWLEPRQ